MRVHRKRKKLYAQWKEAARELGGSFSAPFLSMNLRLEGTIAGFRVMVKTDTRRKSICTRFTLFTVGQIPPAVHITPQRGASLVQFLAGDDIHVGERSFDKEIRMDGPEDMVLAVLNQQARKIIQELVGSRGMTVEMGEIQYRQEGVVDEKNLIIARVREMADAAKALSTNGKTIPQCLLHNVRTEPDESVRRRNFDVLLKRHKGSPEATEAARIAIDAADTELRCSGAIYLGEAGDAAVIPRLISLIPDADAHTISAIGDFLCENGSTDILPMILPCLDDAEPTRVALALKLIGKFGSIEHEPVLISRLQRKEDVIQIAAVNALGRLGTVNAVESLHNLNHSLFTNKNVKDASETAIRDIQGRLGDVDAGRLSLAQVQADEGALSLSGEGGSLSFSGDEAAQPVSGAAGESDASKKSK
jgi:hypothetical protein